MFFRSSRVLSELTAKHQSLEMLNTFETSGLCAGTRYLLGKLIEVQSSINWVKMAVSVWLSCNAQEG